DFSSGVHGARLKIALGLDAGEISGRILGRDGQPLASALVMVGVWKEGQKGDPDNNIRSSDGRYQLKGLRPGKYRVVAVDMAELMNSPATQNPQNLLSVLQAAAETMEIKPGDRLIKDLKVIDKEKLHADSRQ